MPEKKDREKFTDKRIIKSDLKNKEKKWVHIFILLLIASVVVFTSASNNFDIGSFDGALILLSILIGLTSIICVFIFGKRSKAVERAIKDGVYIAKIEYTNSEWSDFARIEYQFRRNEKKGIFYLLTIITVVIFGITIIVIDEAKLAMILVMCSLILLYAFMGFLLPLTLCYLKKERNRGVIIMEKGVYMNGTYHTWDFPLSKLSSVKEIKNKKFPRLEVVYEFFDRLGPRNYTINIPITETSKDSLTKAIKKLKKVNGLEK